MDDAVDDIVRQFRGVSDGLMRKVVGSSSPLDETNSAVCNRNLSWHADEMNKHVSRLDASETVNSFSDNEESHGPEQANGWHSDNELNSKGFPPRVIKRDQGSRTLPLEKKDDLELTTEWIDQSGFLVANSAVTSNSIDDPVGMPPEVF